MDTPAPQGRRSHPGGGADDGGWGPATSVRSSYAASTQAAPPAFAGGYSPPTPHARPAPVLPQAARPAAPPARAASNAAEQRTPERGLSGWAALLVLLAIAGVGGVIDTVSGAQVRGGFNIGIIVASIVAILAVRRSGMFPIVVAPPLIYSGASATMLYLRSGGLHDRKALLDGAANWLVYGFPAIAAATAAVLIIAGLRLIVRR